MKAVDDLLNYFMREGVKNVVVEAHQTEVLTLLTALHKVTSDIPNLSKLPFPTQSVSDVIGRMTAYRGEDEALSILRG